jgi:hypothetical protein
VLPTRVGLLSWQKDFGGHYFRGKRPQKLKIKKLGIYSEKKGF